MFSITLLIQNTQAQCGCPSSNQQYYSSNNQYMNNREEPIFDGSKWVTPYNANRQQNVNYNNSLPERRVSYYIISQVNGKLIPVYEENNSSQVNNMYQQTQYNQPYNQPVNDNYNQNNYQDYNQPYAYSQNNVMQTSNQSTYLPNTNNYNSQNYSQPYQQQSQNGRLSGNQRRTTVEKIQRVVQVVDAFGQIVNIIQSVFPSNSQQNNY